MKLFFLTLFFLLITSQAFAMEDGAAIVLKLPISTRIVNLATMPVEEAIAFCNDRNMACPNIRKEYEKQNEPYAPQLASLEQLAMTNPTITNE